MPEPLTRWEETELFKKIERGDTKARDTMVERNMGLVHKEARRYIGRGMDYDDLVQEGCIGLMKAIEKFDYKKGYKFSTYATWWIRQSIGRAIATCGRSIRLPVNLETKLSKVNSTKEEFYSAYGEKPTNNDLAKALNMDPKRVENILRFNYEETSLDLKIGSEQKDTVIDFIADEGFCLEERICDEIIADEIEKILDELPEREKEAIKMLFGFYGERYYLYDVGQKFGVTVERARQIKNKALRRLKYGKNRRKLNELAEV
ncbi:sigma-70 family RNA polymerase sigma factor [Tepidanaerobacter syntrophicus]|uniref:sigma-70 family RNA polymerase sigma factor n=1 Tax=Tepidanaerobacter syntrophicus TaxID=224999 RepID=UPI001BD3265A|nr:sigma-70 family RNA polymerase sigma factor [Tepidanaerobacter syntrophicus]